MDIVSALFVESFDLRSVPGPATAHRPHRRVLLDGGPVAGTGHPRAPPHRAGALPSRRAGQANLEVVFRRGEEVVARNVQPFTVEPGKFTYRLVRGELEFPDYGTIEAHCRIDQGPATVVPLTLLPPAA